jgi:hypothetical protein
MSKQLVIRLLILLLPTIPTWYCIDPISLRFGILLRPTSISNAVLCPGCAVVVSRVAYSIPIIWIRQRIAEHRTYSGNVKV